MQDPLSPATDSCGLTDGLSRVMTSEPMFVLVKVNRYVTFLEMLLIFYSSIEAFTSEK